MRFSKRLSVLLGILLVVYLTILTVNLLGYLHPPNAGTPSLGPGPMPAQHHPGPREPAPPNSSARRRAHPPKTEASPANPNPKKPAKEPVKKPAKKSTKRGWDEQEVVGKGHSWQQFHRDIGPDALYSEGAPYMTDLLHDLATLKITNASQFHGGTQLKFDITLADGNRVIAKPMRVPRDYVYKYNGKEPFWLDPERHNGEIASFHLDRLLGFRRVPPCTGRSVNLKREILDQTKDFNLLSTVFKSDGNTCVIGSCKPWFCNQDHPSCTTGDMIELSMCQFLPSFHGGYSVAETKYPWSQGLRFAKVWKAENICLEFLKNFAWEQSRVFLDLIDLAILDSFLRNYDRHHYSLLNKYKNRGGSVLYLDNGKSFGNPVTDDISFLAPVYQCCKVRNSTYLRLRELASPESLLSDQLRESMSPDPIAPVVTETHLQALDRRLGIALDTIDKCIKDNGESHVLV